MKARRAQAGKLSRIREQTPSRRGPVLLGIALVVAIFVAHFPAVFGGYIWDDGAFLFENPLIKSTGGLWGFWFSTLPADYWPVTSTMFWIEWRIWGNHPTAYHVGNIMLQGLVALLLWRVLLRLNINRLGAFLAALFFGIHPVTVESVAWIAERKNMLSMLLCLLSILAYLRFEDQGQRKWYVLALLAGAAALLAKTSVVPLPMVLLLLTWWRRKAITRWVILRTAPFFLLSFVLGLVTVWFQHMKAIDKWVVRPEGWASRIASVGWIAGFYLYKSVFPTDLAMTYPRWEIDGDRIISFVPLALLMASLVVFAVYRESWGRAPLAALGCFVIVLSPVLGLLDMAYMRYSLVADHLQYPGVPAIMALIGGGIGAAWTWAKREGKKTPATIAVIVAVMVTLALGVLTFMQARVYYDEITLWSHTIKVNDQAWNAYNNRGNACNGKGLFDQAIADCTKAMEMRPDLAEAHSNRGSAYSQKGMYDQAIRDCNNAIAIKPDFAEAYTYRGNAYVGKGLLDLAIADFNKAIELKPELAEAYSNRGGTYGRMGNVDQAIRDCTKAIEINPEYAEAYGNRGTAYLSQGLIDLAIKDYNKTIEINPDFAEAYCNRGSAYGRKGDYHQTLRDLSKAIELNPRYAEAYRTRAATYYFLKDYDKAWADVRMCRQYGGEPSQSFMQNLINATGRTE